MWRTYFETNHMFIMSHFVQIYNQLKHVCNFQPTKGMRKYNFESWSLTCITFRDVNELLDS